MRVGTSQAWQAEHGLCKDHPHACGDKKFMKQYLIATSGSSPCVWGQVVYTYKLACASRIIPMRVGTSNVETYQTLPYEDHPHACGDKKDIFKHRAGR